MAKGKTDFIFQRPGSENWWVKLRSGGQRIERSLGTPVRAVAELLAVPMIADHKARLLAARPPVGVAWRHDYEPGREHAGPDGGRIIATDRELIYLDKDGRITIRGPNGGGLAFAVPAQNGRPALAVKNGDDAILDTYIRHKGLAEYDARDARNTWALFKQLTDSKPLRDATRDDGRKLVAHFEAQGLKSATVTKKVAWLAAAVNFAIKEGRIKFNPFASVAPERNDKLRRLPLDDADMRECKRNLDRLDKADQVLFRLLASTGMRLEEVFMIEGEAIERGCRYVITGRKTKQSLRRVPLPADALPFLPQAIKGPLFPRPEGWDSKRSARAASKRLNRFLSECGIVDRAKVVHSLRHRAQDRLRAAGCPQDIRWAILGHEEETVAAGYGEGFPVPMLKQWIDRIGF